MSVRSKTLGATGETLAAQYLELQGYCIVDANVRPVGGRARGEIDLIAWDGEFLVFIEVKSRRSTNRLQIAPILAVDYRKRRQIVWLTDFYLAKYRLDDIPIRFDIVEILKRDPHDPIITLHRGAFDRTDCE